MNSLFQYSAQSSSSIAEAVQTNIQHGLTTEEAKKRLAEHGRNELVVAQQRWWKILFRQFTSPFIYLLLGSALLSILLQEFTDGLMIILFIAVNSGIGFYQEYSSEKTAQLLKQYVIAHTNVLRAGAVSVIPAQELVPGDILVLEEGDKLSADVRFIDTYNVSIDESALTGESISVEKTSEALSQAATEYYQAQNMGFSGTVMLKGKATGIVIATGQDTGIGHIAGLTAEAKHVSNFEKGIAGFSRFILKLIVITLMCVFVANIFLKHGDMGVTQLLIFSIALAVSVIPEGLPVVTTFALSRGARQLAKQHVVVKRLSAVEDLGSIEILCTDKTGTLTENKLCIAEIHAADSKQVIWYANLAASSVQQKRLEPFDIAVWGKLATDKQQLLENYTRLVELPFSPVIRRNIVLAQSRTVEDTAECITRGAPESIMELCSTLTPIEKQDITEWIAAQGREGHRVLAVAKKNYSLEGIDLKTTNLEQDTTGFDFVGVISFVDPIKASTPKAIEDAKKLQVQVKVITGDSKEVAGAVAHHIGLTSSPDEVITAEELAKLQPEEYAQALEKYHVFARIAPEQKYTIIQALQKKYEVGFLGEGINDAPALKIAGVSLVVSGASDIAREAADIVLLKADLEVIMNGIREGRRVFVNTTKYIQATLASNIGNFFAVAIASLLIDFLPMLPLQILLLNLLSDFPMIAMSTDTVEDSDLQSPKQYSIKDTALLAMVLGIVSTVFDFIFFGLYYHISPETLHTNWFIASIITELAFIFSIRSKRFFLFAKRPSFPLLLMTIPAAVITFIIPFTAIGRRTFDFIVPQWNDIVTILCVVIAFFIATEAVKLLYYRKSSKM